MIKIKTLQEQLELKENELKDLKLEQERTQKSIKILNSSSDSLDKILSAGKLFGSQYGLECGG